VHKRILVVDDEVDICTYLKDALEDESHEVDVAKTGDEALDKLSQTSFDAVLIDIRLETQTSGVDVIKRCRELPSRPSIIVVSATPERLLRPIFDQEGISSSIETFLEKPADIKPDVIVRRVNTVLSKRG
jgi:DNA-binding response OmpR family regulator